RDPRWRHPDTNTANLAAPGHAADDWEASFSAYRTHQDFRFRHSFLSRKENHFSPPATEVPLREDHRLRLLRHPVENPKCHHGRVVTPSHSKRQQLSGNRPPI